jgi:hypothetical protein
VFQFVQIGRIAFLKLAVREACSFARLLPAWTRSSLYRSPTRAGIHAKIPAELLPLIKLPPVIVELVLFELGGDHFLLFTHIRMSTSGLTEIWVSFCGWPS